MFCYTDIYIYMYILFVCVSKMYLGGSVAEWLVVRVPDLKSGCHGFKSRSEHLAGVVSRWTLVQLLRHACI